MNIYLLFVIKKTECLAPPTPQLFHDSLSLFNLDILVTIVVLVDNQ